MKAFEQWCRLTQVASLHPDRDRIREIYGDSVPDSRRDAKAAWDYQQKQIDHLEEKVKLLTECVEDLSDEGFDRATQTLEKLKAMEKEG